MLGQLDQILKRDGFIIYVSGAKEKGKTDFSLLLAEYCYLKGYRAKIATNIETESYMIEKQIVNLPDLKVWLQESKRKLFILDEAGLSIPKVRFMTNMNVEIMKILQMIRHYDAGFIGIAPSTKNIDSTFMNTDILDAHIKKINKHLAVVADYLQGSFYKLQNIPRTSINFNSKHIAEFVIEKKTALLNAPLEEQVAYSYGTTGNMATTAKLFQLDVKEVQRLVQKHCRNRVLTVDSQSGGITNHQVSPNGQTTP